MGKNETAQLILDEIGKVLADPNASWAQKTAHVLRLAESYAWVNSPGSSHGSSASVPAS